MDIKISASLLGCDLANIENEIKRAENAGIDWVHYDVMDGLFVGNVTFGEPVLKSIAKKTSLPIDVHLMIVDPIRYIDNYSDLGADIITVHYEACGDTSAVIDKIHSRGVKAGLSIKPNTQVEEILQYIDKVEMVLVMTVEPGFGGQVFLESTLEKIAQVRKYVTDNNLDVMIQVDGGINADTARLVKQSGADVLVSGSYVFGAENMTQRIQSLKQSIK